MATGICYTQSGNVKRYEASQLGTIPKNVTGYTVGYPSTTYYNDYCYVSFSIVSYPPPPSYPEVEGFVEGTAHYYTNLYLNDSGKKIYDLMSYTPPDGYELSEDGTYTYTATATIYAYNYDIKYGDAINTISMGAVTPIEKEFKYKKIDKPNIYKYYKVVFTISGGSLHCRCDRVTDIPGTNSGNVDLGISITITSGNSREEFEYFTFSWIMKNGINESKPCRYNKYMGSGFTTRSSWEQDNGDGTKTYYTFTIDSQIP